jgi:hypothetical protein
VGGSRNERRRDQNKSENGKQLEIRNNPPFDDKTPREENGDV